MDKVHLEELFDIGSSKRVFQSDWRNSGIPFYRAREIAKLAAAGSVDNELFIDEELYQEYITKYGKPEAGDIMVTGVGTLGVCYIVKENDEFYFKDGNILWFHQKAKNKVLSEYVVKAFNSKNIKEQIQRNSSGTTVGTFTIQTAKKIELEFPCMEEQIKIVSILGRLEKIIEMRKNQLDSLDNLIKSRFVEVFGDPVSNPKHWSKKKLIDICNKLTDGTHFSPENLDTGEYKYITAKNIKESGFDLSNLTYVTKEVHDSIYSRCNPEYGDVLYIKDGVTTGIAMVNSLNEEFSLLSSVALLKQKRDIINGHYLCGILNNSQMYISIRKNMGGAAITRLTIAKLNVIEIPVPPLDLQNQFAAFVHQIDKLKFAYSNLSL